MYPQFDATRRYEMLEIQIPANSTATRFNVPDQPQLRTDQDADIIIQAIETFDVLGIPLSPNNVPVATQAFLQQTYLTLYVEGEESLYRIPLIQIKRIANEAAASPYQWILQKLKNVQVDWTKSYFFTPVAYGAGVFATFSFLLGVHYEKLPTGTMAKIRAKELDLLQNP
jgi:hypothetical protein